MPVIPWKPLFLGNRSEPEKAADVQPDIQPEESDFYPTRELKDWTSQRADREIKALKSAREHAVEVSLFQVFKTMDEVLTHPRRLNPRDLVMQRVLNQPGRMLSQGSLNMNLRAHPLTRDIDDISLSHILFALNMRTLVEITGNINSQASTISLTDWGRYVLDRETGIVGTYSFAFWQSMDELKSRTE